VGLDPVPALQQVWSSVDARSFQATEKHLRKLCGVLLYKFGMQQFRSPSKVLREYYPKYSGRPTAESQA
jgi:hypothetical protein